MTLLDVLSLDTPALGLVALASFAAVLGLVNGCVWAWDWWKVRRNELDRRPSDSDDEHHVGQSLGCSIYRSVRDQLGNGSGCSAQTREEEERARTL